MEDKDNDDYFDTVVEIDETCWGRKPRKKNKGHDDNNSGGLKCRGTKKTPIVTIVDREERKVFAKVSKMSILSKVFGL